MITESESNLRVLVIEDEPTIVEFLRVGLGYEGYEVSIATDGNTALKLARAETHDVLLLDLMLPGVDGLEICRRLRSWGNDSAIIILTAKSGVPDRIAGLDLGADDYISKPFTFEELLARIRAVLRRRGRLSQQGLIKIGELTLCPETREANMAGAPLDLTPREFALLELFMRHPRRVFTRETLINRIWGFNFAGDTNVVDVHVSHLRHKIGGGTHRLIQTVHGVGYALRPDGDRFEQ